MEHQTFWKPEKKVKEKKQWKPGPKKEKTIAPWRQGILSSHQSNPSRADRAEFPKAVVAELIREAGGKCQCGCGRPDTETHHIMPRTRGGRGVKTNGMRVHGICNQRFHGNEEELQKWIEIYRKKYGEYFWFDEQDWTEHAKKQTMLLEAETEKQQRLDELGPIVTLLSTAAGRKLSAKEVRLLDGMDTREAAVFAKLMRDVVGGVFSGKPAFGYGKFDD